MSYFPVRMRASKIVALLLLIGQSLAALDAWAITHQHYGNDAPWYINRIPLFESSNQAITDVYYYRWSIFRSHQRDLGANGFVSTEFLLDVSWETLPWATINDATGFHILEGRWLRDLTYKNDYAKFMYSANSNRVQYSECMADSVWKAYLVDGDSSVPLSLLPAMQDTFNIWSTPFWEGSFDTSKGLYWIIPLSDATEYTISSIDASGGTDGFAGGNAFRPSINSYQYGNAKAIANLAALQGGMQSTVDNYNQIAASIKANVQASLWSNDLVHFIDRYQVTNEYVTYWNPIRGRELVGFVPWTHDLPDDTAQYGQAWRHLLNPNEFNGPYGLRTNEPSYQYYMVQYRYAGTSRECQWNGPAWPYQTTQVLTGLANLLDHYPQSSNGIIGTLDYIRILTQYANLHYNPNRNGNLVLEEDYDSATGAPIVGLARSPHYFHSGYVDHILSGFVGIRPRSDNVLEVNPLIDSTITYFRADNILYHGHNVAVQWDATGSHYGTQGYSIEVDGARVAWSWYIQRFEYDFGYTQAPPFFSHPIAQSVQLQADSSGYPAGSVSVANADPAGVHGAIDGRVTFFPEWESANGWNTPVVADGTELWYQIDFGNQILTNSAEIAFFANADQGYAAPLSYTVQVVYNGVWYPVTGAGYAPVVANGITCASWNAVWTTAIRLVFTPAAGQKARLVEFKVFSELNTC